jgi:hypothetical protein
MRSAVAVLTVIGGLLEVASVLGVLFLPVVTSCAGRLTQSGTPSGSAPPSETITCVSYPYLGHGNPLGYTLLALVALGGIAAIASLRLSPLSGAIVRWAAAVTSLLIAYVMAFGLGPYLLPGSFILLLAVVIGSIPRWA